MKHLKPLALSLGAIAVIAVLGAGCAVPWLNKAKPEPVITPTSTVQTGEVDMTDWKINRVEELGFEVQAPKYWDIGAGRLGPKDSDFGPYWSAKDVIGFGGGRVYGGDNPQGGTVVGPYNVNIYVSVKDIPEKTLKEAVSESHGSISIYNASEMKIGELDALYDDNMPTGINTAFEEVLIQSGSKFYYIELLLNAKNEQDFNRGIAEWHEILKTFKPIPIVVPSVKE